MAQYDLNVGDYIRILRKRRYYLIGPPLVLAILTYLLTPAPVVSCFRLKILLDRVSVRAGTIVFWERDNL